MEFHQKLKELRKQQGLTQEALADKLFVTRAAISKWESGRGYPNIDTLKSISSYFSISIDDLLSGDELLTAVEASSRQRACRIRDTVYGLLDCCIALLLFLPLFGQRGNEIVVSVSLLSIQEISAYLRMIYYVLVFGITLWGLLTLALQNSANVVWNRIKSPVSLTLSILGVIVFIISSQAYCACLLFVFLSIKTLILIKMH